MKKKIGIITIHDILNYGSVLQAYATQNILSRNGYDSEIIDYKYPNEYHGRKPSLKAITLKRINGLLKDLIPGRKYSTYINNYKSFKEKNYILSKYRYNSVNELIKNPPEYDIYLSGSDQIWRPEFVKDDPCFFLDFVKSGRRISYASSFSSTAIPEKYKETYRNYLRKYEHIGVREKSGVNIVNELINRNATLVLDPTLLLDKDDWLQVANLFKTKKPYILCYGQNMGDSYMERLAEHIRSLLGLKIVRLNGKFYDYFNKNMEYILDAGPSEFLGLFANASFILAQSYHGTIFSIIFEKPFLSILRNDFNHDSRQVNLLQMLDLNDRKAYIGEDFSTLNEVIQKEVDFSNTNRLLHIERTKSLKFLLNSLS